jgi:hypothetical protein
MKFLKKGKLIPYSNNDANEFAIKIGSEVLLIPDGKYRHNLLVIAPMQDQIQI